LTRLTYDARNPPAPARSYRAFHAFNSSTIQTKIFVIIADWLTMGWLSFLKKEDSNLSDFSERAGVLELNKTRKRPLSSSPLVGNSRATKAGKEGSSKKVSFNSVTVRIYNLILGDNDGCNVPLSIGWKWVESKPMPVDIYDMMHHQGPDYVGAMKMSPLAVEERKQRLYDQPAIVSKTSYIKNAVDEYSWPCNLLSRQLKLSMTAHQAQSIPVFLLNATY
jgi:hypothetical protein